MKLNHFFYKLLLVVISFFCFKGFSQNLLNNGNFETGTVIGFFSNGAGYVRLTPPFSGNTNSGNWALVTNPQLINTASFVSVGDHTTGTGIMMAIDGNTTGGQQNFWEAGNGGGGVCGLTIGATYTFSYWIRSIYGPVSGTPTPAIIGVDILNANSVTLVSGSLTAPPTANGWQQVVFTFKPNGSCVNIKLYNNNTSFDGNDFAVDDFSVTAAPLPLSLSVSFSNVTCPNANNGSIVVSGVNGVQPYVNYSLSGTASQTNSTGIFSGLAPGTYAVSVSDSNSPPSVVTQSNIIITQPANLNVSASPTSICAGSPTILSVSGSANPYTWTASPADPTLVAPNSASPTVSPTQPTTYTASSTSTSTSTQLITNGNFSSGNTGFTTDYQFLTVTVPAGAQRTYGIVTNSNSWFGGFSPCTANGGSGNMMVVDGSNLNGGNDRVWCQTVTVVPGQNYTFSYFIQTVATPNPANIDVLINGVSIGSALAPTTSCSWVQRTYTWNSGVSTTAQICMYDRTTTTSGNDFALDDISFTGALTCNLSNSVTVTVTPSLSPTISCGIPTANSVTFNWTTVAGATSYIRSYSINGGALVNLGSLPSLSQTINALSPGDSVQIFVTPVGTGCFTQSTQTCLSLLPCSLPNPVASVTQQPTCTISTGTIVFTSPLNTTPIPVPSDLFISEVTDESTGALSYIEIYNATGVSKNLVNYKLKIYNNGNPGPSLNCDFPLVGTLANNDVYIVSIGSTTNQDGVVPDLVVNLCAGFNTNDNIRLTTSTDVEVDLWGRTDGVDFTPGNLDGYTYRRLANAPHPSLIWNPADWLALDPQDYTNIGTYQFVIYEYSVNGSSYQSSPTFTGLAPGTYNVTVKDIISGCISNSLTLVVTPVPSAPNVSATTFNQADCTVKLIGNSTNLGVTITWNGPGLVLNTPNPGTATQSGTYTVTVFDPVSGCSSSTSVNVTITPPPSTVVTITQPTCTVPTGFIIITSPLGANLEYSIDGTNYQVSPSFPNLIPGTYNVSVRDLTSGCISSPIQSTINPVPNLIIPTFSPFSPLCVGDTAPVLPTTSLNGITGTWNPSTINTSSFGTSLYTFTPNAGQCASVIPIPITVNPLVTPTFNYTTITTCIPDFLPTVMLNTTSNNNIVGTWFPDQILIVPGTTTYTFTPNAGQCATTFSFQWTMNPLVTPTFNSIPALCFGSTAPVLATTSLNGISGTWSPSTIDTSVSGSTIHTFTPDVGECANPITLSITVAPQLTPVISIVQLCSSNSVTVTSPIGNNFQYAVDGGPFQISPLFLNIAPGNHNIVVNQINANCFSNPINFIINPVINDVFVNTPQPLRFCDPNNDGFGTFDLTQAINSITGGVSYTVTFHETITDANIDGTAISNTTAYLNINLWTQIIYVRVESITTSCYEVVQLQLIVDPTPEATEPDDYVQCDYTGVEGFESFDLTTKIPQILGSINPALTTVTFHTTLAAAQSDTNAISTSYTNQTIWNQTLYVRVETIATGCYDIVTLNLIVNPLPNSIQPNYPPYSLCDTTGAIGFETFNLASKIADILLGQTGMSVTFYPSLLNAQNNTNAITNLNYQNPRMVMALVLFCAFSKLG